LLNRNISDSKNDVVEKHQHMPETACDIGLLCQYFVNSSTDFGGLN
jgi:hypothetical protein